MYSSITHTDSSASKWSLPLATNTPQRCSAHSDTNAVADEAGLSRATNMQQRVHRNQKTTPVLLAHASFTSGLLSLGLCSHSSAEHPVTASRLVSGSITAVGCRPHRPKPRPRTAKSHGTEDRTRPAYFGIVLKLKNEGKPSFCNLKMMKALVPFEPPN